MMNSQQQYTCPMHPEIIRDQPGSCPICGMNLVPVQRKENEKPVHHVEMPAEEKLSHTQHSTSIIKANSNQCFHKYTYPMHPQNHSGRAGKTPIMWNDFSAAGKI